MCSFINNIYSSYRLFNKLFGLYRIGKDKPLVVGFMNFYFSDPRYINVNVKVLNYFLFRRIKRFFLSNGFSFNNDWHGFKDWLVLKQIYWKGARNISYEISMPKKGRVKCGVLTKVRKNLKNSPFYFSFLPYLL